MKRLLLILSIILIFTSCFDEVEQPQLQKSQSIFDTKENIVVDGQSIQFNLSKEGIYTLTLIDKETNQVISRERFIGVINENSKFIYTKSIQSQHLYLLLEDFTKTEIGKTTLMIK
jgi:uncharacterized protein VirK/YbjX